ncbi:MAG: T9SS type A sorting domain-containing protein [Bacteroidia bacterium]
MKNKTPKRIAALLLCLGISASYAQQSANAAGGDASGSGGSVAFSVGQVVYTTASGTGGTANQGVQQVYQISTVGAVETALNLSLSAFPNPTVNNLMLQVADFNNENLLYELYDLRGKLLESSRITAYQTQINTSTLPAATYFLNVLHDDKKVQTFKIIKN